MTSAATGIEFNTLYPGTVTASKGDKVTFSIVGFHTVTLLGKGQKLPPLIGPSQALNPAANDPAGVPYWWGGPPRSSSSTARPSRRRAARPSAARRPVSSGMPAGNAPEFTVTFPKKGTFQVRCIVHPNMTGTVKVVYDSSDTAKKQRARSAKELASQTATVNKLVAKANKVTGPVVSISPGTKKAQLFAFVPANRKVAVGSTSRSTWTVATRSTRSRSVPSRSPRLWPRRPSRGTAPTSSARASTPSDPPAAGVPSLTPTSHGNGFLNSGVLADKGTGIPASKSFKITFPQAGTFTYHCLVHFDMKGTITVARAHPRSLRRPALGPAVVFLALVAAWLPAGPSNRPRRHRVSR